MDEIERQDLLAMQREIERLLRKLEEKIIGYPPKAADEPFNFMLKKAVVYRELLREIQSRLRGS